MTFTTSIKEEIARQDIDNVNSINLLSAFIRFHSNIRNNNIELVMENAAVTRYIYKILKNVFRVSPSIIVRNQRRFRIKQIYILVINDSVSDLLEKLNIMADGKIILPSEYFLSEDDEKISYLKGLFLAVGSVSNPQNSGYHLEFVLNHKNEADFINKKRTVKFSFQNGQYNLL